MKSKKAILKTALMIVLLLIMIFLLYISVFGGRVTLRAYSAAIPPGSAEIVCTLSNPSLRYVQYGQPYLLEKYDNGRWNNIEMYLRFELGLFGLWPLSSKKLTFPLWALETEELTQGRYRIVFDVKDRDGLYTLYCEFEVK